MLQFFYYNYLISPYYHGSVFSKTIRKFSNVQDLQVWLFGLIKTDPAQKSLSCLMNSQLCETDF